MWFNEVLHDRDIGEHVGYGMLSPETVGSDPLCAPPDGRGSGWGPVGASLVAPTPPPLRESSHTWMELHLPPHTGSLLQPEGEDIPVSHIINAWGDLEEQGDPVSALTLKLDRLLAGEWMYDGYAAQAHWTSHPPLWVRDYHQASFSVVQL